MNKYKNHVVIKLGGSLIENAHELLIYLQDRMASTNTTVTQILIVPGGSIFADSIRDLCQTKSISDDSAHWMAILGMEQYGYYLADKSGVMITEDVEKTVNGISILLPYRLMRNVDPLPHSWDVTSDCIAGWIASMLNARLIKVTDVDGIYIDEKIVPVLNASELIKREETCVDKMLPELLVKERIDCLVINGKYPQRVLDAINKKDVKGTLIKGNI